MKFILKTNSPLLPSSGVANIIDDISYHSDSSGVPFIPGKTLKGLLREAAHNLADLFVASQPAFPKDQLIKNLFGSTGIDEGIIFFPNLYLKQVGIRVINFEKDGQQLEDLVSVTRNQTSIEEDVAKEGSLRKYRLIKEGSRFEGDSDSNLNENAKLFLHLSCLLVERMGVRRNRGWGNISIHLDEKIFDLDDRFKTLKKITDINDFELKSNTGSEENSEFILKGNTIYLKITTTSPIILGEIDRSSFNVDSKSYIPGRTIRGIFATKYIKQKCLIDPIMDPVFRSLFLENKIKFGNAIICNEKSQFDCIPNNIVYSKYGKRSLVRDLFKLEEPKDPDKQEKTKNISEYGWIENGVLQLTKVRKNNHFHQERDRFSGRNKDGKIYYYESINEGQTFICEIEGASPEFLKLNPQNARIGRSRSAQYGQITIEAFDPQGDHTSLSDREDKQKTWTVFAASPLIFLNDETGIYDPGSFDKQIVKIFPDCEIKNCAVKFGTERFYQPQWHSYDNLIPCISVGSSFNLLLSSELKQSEIEDKIKKGIGVFKELGFGKLRVLKYDTDQIKVESLGKKDESKVITIDKNKEKALRKSEELYKKGKLTNSLCGGMIYELLKLTRGDQLFWRNITTPLTWEEYTEKLFLKENKKWKDFEEQSGRVLKPAAGRLNESGILNDIRSLKSTDKETIDLWIKVFKYLQKRNSHGS